MRNFLVGGLIVLNIILALAVMASLFQIPTAKAQTLGLSGNYLMVNGTILGIPNDVVYIVDLPNRQISALIYDPTTQVVVNVGSRDLIRDLGVGTELGIPRPGATRRVPAVRKTP
ncbi:MAG: hypothetical protein WC975_01115 [Phycisphaerae bacterium]